MAKYTIKDIAREAKVGVGTVSRVINNHPSVKEETREKVLKIIKALNFKPNAIARNLKKNNKNIIGILVRGNYNPFFDEIIIGINKELKKENLTSIIHHTGLESFENEVSTLIDHNVRGIIYLGGRSDEEIEELDIPLVLVSTSINNPNGENFDIVTIDNEKSAYKSVKHLIETGCRKIGMIISNKKDELAIERINGYRKALIESNLEVKEPYEVSFETEYTAYGGYIGARYLLDQEDIDGIFVISDLMAIGASRLILERNYRIPHDISIIGFDGIEEAKYYYPSISTIMQPREEMGIKGAKLLIKRLFEEKEEIEKICLEVEIIKRESTQNK